MDWEYNIVSGRNLLIVRSTGKFSVESFEKMITEITSDARWSPGMDCLADHSALDLTETKFYEIEAAANIHKRYDARLGQSGVAVVLGSEASYGLGRMYEAYLGSDVLATVKSFRTTDEARQWLAEDNGGLS